MLLDKLISNLHVSVEPFALCDIRKGWRLSLQPPRALVLHFVIAGRGRLHYGGSQPDELRPDVLIVMPPTVAHSIESEQPVLHEMQADASTLLSGQVQHVIAGDGEDGLTIACGRVEATYGGLSGLFDRLQEPIVVDFSDSAAVRSVFALVLAEGPGGAPGSVSMLSALMSQCFILLLRRLSEQGDDRLPWLAVLGDPALSRVVDAMLERPEHGHTLDSLTALAGMSRSTLYDRFRAALGRPPMDFLRDARLRKAASLLHRSDLPVKTVAAKVGFNSRSHFSHAFAEYFGVPPAEFRLARKVVPAAGATPANAPD